MDTQKLLLLLAVPWCAGVCRPRITCYAWQMDTLNLVLLLAVPWCAGVCRPRTGSSSAWQWTPQGGCWQRAARTVACACGTSRRARARMPSRDSLASSPPWPSTPTRTACWCALHAPLLPTDAAPRLPSHAAPCVDALFLSFCPRSPVEHGPSTTAWSQRRTSSSLGLVRGHRGVGNGFLLSK